MYFGVKEMCAGLATIVLIVVDTVLVSSYKLRLRVVQICMKKYFFL